KRRLEIARALVCEPLMIMLDEPFAAVDPLTKTDIQGIVRELAHAGIAILVTDHDVDRVLEIADRVYLITEGKVRCHGTPGEIVRNPVALTTYLGEQYRPRDYVPQGYLTSEPIYAEPPPQMVVRRVLDQEHVRGLIDGLMGDEQQFQSSASELLVRGEESLPALLEELERRDMEMRRRAYAVLHRLTEGQAVFDPHAPPVMRQQQLAALRERFMVTVG